MRHILIAAALAVAAAGALAESALAACSELPASQPFLDFGDKRHYVPAPGGDFSDPDSAWELRNGAAIAADIQPDGSLGGVLDLPSRAQATSPVMCVTEEYPKARLWAQNLGGSGSVSFHVSYLEPGGGTRSKSSGRFHGAPSEWRLSHLMNVHPRHDPGWQEVRFTFTAGGRNSRFLVDELWVDPFKRG